VNKGIPDVPQGTIALEYDSILDFTLLSEIGSPYFGWSIIPSEQKKNRVKEFIKPLLEENDEWIKLSRIQIGELSQILIPQKKTSIAVSVSGFFDKGKTFLLNKLASLTLGSGQTITTKGLSIKLPDESFNFILLDTAGTNSPITVDLMEKTKDELLKKGEITEIPPLDPKLSGLEYKTAEKERNEKVDHQKDIIHKRAMVNKKTS